MIFGKFRKEMLFLFLKKIYVPVQPGALQPLLQVPELQDMVLSTRSALPLWSAGRFNSFRQAIYTW